MWVKVFGACDHEVNCLYVPYLKKCVVRKEYIVNEFELKASELDKSMDSLLSFYVQYDDKIRDMGRMYSAGDANIKHLLQKQLSEASEKFA